MAVKNVEEKKEFVFYDYWNRPPLVGEKLSQEPCELFDNEPNPISRKEQCLRAFAVGELATGGSKLGAIDEKTFVQCDDPEDLECILDECEDMGDCVLHYNKFLLNKYKADKELNAVREKYQADKKAEFEKYQEWLKNQQKQETPKESNNK